jgi:hypothetical protein
MYVEGHIVYGTGPVMTTKRVHLLHSNHKDTIRKIITNKPVIMEY